MIRFSNKELFKKKAGEVDKSIKGSKATKRAEKSISDKDTGKYIVRIVDGVKYMTHKN